MTLPPITKKQHSILNLLYQFRFLTSTHIQFLLNHKNRTRINNWLTDLVEKKYVARIFKNKLKENTKPAVYYIAGHGIKYLRTQEKVNVSLLTKLHREKHRSATFREYQLFIADMYINVLKDAAEMVYTLHFYTKVDLASFEFLNALSPTAYFVKEKKKASKRYLVEVFKDNMPRFAIRSRIKQYIEYSQGNEWSDNTGYSFPTVLFLCPTKSMFEYIYRFTQKIFEEGQITTLCFQLSTIEKLQQYGMHNRIWKSIPS